MKVGYIGLGAMGSALARRLLTAHSVTVWDINRAAVAAFQELGASAASSAAHMARECEVVVLCLPRSSDVRQVIFGPGGLAEGVVPGQIVIDQTSGTPAETAHIAQELAQRGVVMLDAPVSGNPMVVESGRGTIMVSGPDEVYDRALPVLRELSANVLHCGRRLGDAQAMKLVNNTMNAGCRLATLEVVAMARKIGLSLSSIIEIVNDGPAKNSTTRTMLPALLEGKASTNFALALMLKDLNQSTQLGMECGAPMPIAALVRALLQIGVNTLGKDARLEDVVRLVESMAAARIVGPDIAPSRAATPEERNAIASTVAACNYAVTWEAATMGFKYGLSLEDLARVITTSSGWSKTAERILPGLASGVRNATPRVDAIVQDLGRVSRIAADCGAPLLIANAARSLLEAGAHQLGSGAGLDAMAERYGTMAGIAFPRV